MASIRIAARRGTSSLLDRLVGRVQPGLNVEAASLGRRSVHIGSASQLLATAAAATDVTRPSITSPAPTALDNYAHPPNSAFAPLGLTTRSFGRKGSRMGHHIQNLDEMAHSDSREEAKHRREEKKKKSKKARMSSQKEGGKESDEATGGEDNAGGGDEDIGPKEDEFGNPLLPETSAVKATMMMVVASLERSFASIRGGEATPELFDAVRVSAYGETVPLSSVGQVVIEDPQRATIACYDPSIAPDVRDAVRDMPGMNLNPYVEEGGSGVVIIPIPRASEETRKEMVKELGRQAENGKQRVRNIRRKANDVINKGKQGKLDGISKDDAFRVGKEVDAVTEEVLAVMKDIVERKQKSVMED